MGLIFFQHFIISFYTVELATETLFLLKINTIGRQQIWRLKCKYSLVAVFMLETRFLSDIVNSSAMLNIKREFILFIGILISGVIFNYEIE